MFNTFTAWESLMKSRAEEVSKMAAILNEKEASDITFTAINPQTGTTEEYVLGSIEGNAKFLLGYCNPGFRLAPYHFMVIDPSLTEEDAQRVYDEKGHPADPAIWAEFGVEPFAEGDKEGTPHPEVGRVKEEDNTFDFTFRGKSYTADPENQIVISTSEDKVYHWSLLRNTFFASQNEELYQLMELHKVIKLVSKIPLKEEADSHKGYDFKEDVSPLAKAVLPRPGSLIKLENDVIGLVTDCAVWLCDKEGVSKSLNISGTEVESVVLNPEQGVGSVILVDFLSKYFRVDMQALESYT